MSRPITRGIGDRQPTLLTAGQSAESSQAVPAGRAGARLHAFAWWGWAICAMVVMMCSYNPLLIVTAVTAVIFVVLQCRSTDPWANSLKAYLWAAVIVLAIRLFFQLLVGGTFDTGQVLIRLPEVPLPDWMAGIRLGGDLTLDGLLFTLYDAGRLAGLLICVGAANALANPKRALKSVPAAFHQISTAIVIGLTLLPQLIESGRRISRARQLRGTPTKSLRGMVSLFIPVLADGVDRSMSLAASMESRGYGATKAGVDEHGKTMQSTTLIAAALSLTFGTFALLSVPNAWPAALLIVLGFVLGGIGLQAAGRRLAVTRFDADPWRLIETAVVGCGIAAMVLVLVLNAHTPAMRTSTSPAQWPELPLPMLLIPIFLALPGFFAPAPARGARR